ncbi:conserved hypothetical protein [Vibrio phage 495E54-1]|nr:conserved hypothetical protein [Vibrio phage 495E54-1]
MTKVKVVNITVDTNDGDYESHIVDISEMSEEKVQRFFALLKHLPTTENYYYHNGERVSRGYKIRWGHERVGKYLDYGGCALESMVLSKEEISTESLTTEEVYEEGFILQEDYELLCDFLPMYINEGFGFHTIISVTVEEHTQPVVLWEYEIK